MGIRNPFHRIRTIPIANCVHFCGFAYGKGAINPYENYIVGLASGEPESQLRSKFEDLICHYRPRDLAQALGTTTSRSVPMWLLPWKSWRKLFQRRAWCRSPDEVIDILTYFCPQGIRASRFDEEYFWLQEAWLNIRDNGYRPEAHTYISVFELKSADSSKFIVVDGNHRLAAMAALGKRDVVVVQPLGHLARRAHAGLWPLVLSKHILKADALQLFDAYFNSNQQPFRATERALILKEST